MNLASFLFSLQIRYQKREEIISNAFTKDFVTSVDELDDIKSSFTREAIAFVNKQQQKSIKLIDGELLSDLLVKHCVGIDVAQSLELYKLDADYFIE